MSEFPTLDTATCRERCQGRSPDAKREPPHLEPTYEDDPEYPFGREPQRARRCFDIDSFLLARGAAIPTYSTLKRGVAPGGATGEAATGLARAKSIFPLTRRHRDRAVALTGRRVVVRWTRIWGPIAATVTPATGQRTSPPAASSHRRSAADGSRPVTGSSRLPLAVEGTGTRQRMNELLAEHTPRTAAPAACRRRRTRVRGGRRVALMVAAGALTVGLTGQSAHAAIVLWIARYTSPRGERRCRTTQRSGRIACDASGPASPASCGWESRAQRQPLASDRSGRKGSGQMSGWAT